MLNNLPNPTTDQLANFGQQIRARRKSLKVNATIVAEACDLSRVTLHRIEKGEPTVAMGAYLNVAAALGLKFDVLQITPQATEISPNEKQGWIPARVRLADYPQLKQLAWQVLGTDTLTPAEALSIYERNWRHIDEAALDARERDLIAALRLGLGTYT